MFNALQPRSPPPMLALSPASMKRKRASSDAVLTPPLSIDDPEGACLLTRAVHVLSTAATSLSQVTFLYQTDPTAREGLLRAVECLQTVAEAGGKLILCGVGKSGLVGRKTVASMKSLGIPCSFLHPSEALHGDLGDIRPNDAVLFISYSGKTTELLAVLSHIPASIPILAITSQTSPSDCPLLHNRANAILLPAPIHEKEETSFGVCAPTTSTTVTIAVGDMLALTLAEALHDGRTKEVFRRNHPGGAIGEMARRKGVVGGRQRVEEKVEEEVEQIAEEEEQQEEEETKEEKWEDIAHIARESDSSSDIDGDGDRAKRRKCRLASPAATDL